MRWATLAFVTAIVSLGAASQRFAHHHPIVSAALVGGNDSSSVIKIVGIGASTCAELEREIATGAEPERTYFAWAQGFMSGILNRAPAGVDEGIDLMPPTFPLQRQADFIRNYCAQNPMADYSDGVLALYRELRRRSKL